MAKRSRGSSVAEALQRALASWPAGPVVVALSGGLDSTVLLHACAADDAIRLRGLRALHVDHALHADSAAWARRCAELAASLGVPFEAVRVTVERGSRHGPEGAARRARYAAFEATLAGGGVLATAHHADDQAETVLLRLLRGAGPDGLGAMRALRPLGAGWLARPLLALGRRELAAYAAEHALRWIDDPSNACLDHDRNLLRERVLPVLRERWPHAAQSLGASASLAAAAARIVDATVDAELAALQGPDPATLPAAGVAALDDYRRGALLRRWYLSLGLAPPPPAALARVVAELIDVPPDRAPFLRWPGAALRRYRGTLYATRVDADPPAGWCAAWDGSAPLALPAGCGALALEQSRPGGALAAGAPVALTVRFRAGGERLRMRDGGPTRDLRVVWQELAVPPWLRARTPLAYDGDALVAIGDLLLAEPFRARLASAGARLRWSGPAN